MEINQRIKYLRKEILKLKQEEFGKRINISRSAIGSIEIGRTNPTNRFISDLVREYGVSEKWLKEGKGDIFQSNDNDPFIQEIIRLYNILNEDNRKYLRGYMDRLLQEQQEKE